MSNSFNSREIGYPIVGKGITLGLAGYVVLWYLQLAYRIPVLGVIRFEYIYAIILFITGLIFAPKLELDSPLIRLALLLLLSMVIQIPFSQNIEVSYNVFIDRVIKFGFMSILIILCVRNPQSLIFFLGAFLLACMKMGQEGLVGRITGSLMWENQGVLRLHGPTPIYHHPNSFAGMALGSLPFAIYLFPISSKIIKAFLIGLIILALNIIIFTGSRTGYIAFIILLVYLSLTGRGKLAVLSGVLIIATISLFYLDRQYVERLETIYTGEDKEGQSIEMRKEILSDAIKVFSSYPFGVGISAFPTVRKRLFGREQDTHNLYLEVATNLGIQGLIIFLVVIYGMMKVLIRLKNEFNYQKNEISKFADSMELQNNLQNSFLVHIRDLELMEGTSRALILFLIVRLSLGLFGMDLYEIYWWFSLGLAVALSNMSKYSTDKTNRLIGEISKA
jgi:putative inorganic carbon (hco3(-)) transporter